MLQSPDHQCFKSFGFILLNYLQNSQSRGYTLKGIFVYPQFCTYMSLQEDFLNFDLFLNFINFFCAGNLTQGLAHTTHVL
jgi:hypothetical protein